MRGSEFIAAVRGGGDAAALALQAARTGSVVLEWVPLVLAHPDVPGKSLTIRVSRDALRIGTPGDSVRLSTSHGVARALALALNAYLPTAKISDEIFRQAAHRLNPVPLQGSDQQRKSLEWMLKHHDGVEAQAAGKSGLLAPVGKELVLTRLLWNDPTKGAIYGWHGAGSYEAKTLPIRVIQPLSVIHGVDYGDYSQVLRLVARFGQLCDSSGCRTVDLADVLRDPVLHKLVSHEGPLPAARPPDVAMPSWTLPSVPTTSSGGKKPPAAPRPGVVTVAGEKPWLGGVVIAGAVAVGAVATGWYLQRHAA